VQQIEVMYLNDLTNSWLQQTVDRDHAGMRPKGPSTENFIVTILNEGTIFQKGPKLTSQKHLIRPSGDSGHLIIAKSLQSRQCSLRALSTGCTIGNDHGYFHCPSLVATMIFIATPTSGGTAKMPYVISLVGLVASLERQGVPTMYANFDGANVSEQRDALAYHFLASTATHLLFIDSDMSFPANLAEALLALDKPFVGTAYAKRQIDLAKLAKTGQLTSAFSFNVKLSRQQRSDVCEAEGIGFGFVLLRRDCVEALDKRISRYPSRYVNGAMVAGLFRPIQLPTGEMLSEDVSFCERWRGIGGRVFVYTKADIKHVGDFAFGIPFLDMLGPSQ
jgi:hypothetical protein